jgi:hypothetical protein
MAAFLGVVSFTLFSLSGCGGGNGSTAARAGGAAATGETELRGVVFAALVMKLGANVMNQKPDLVTHDLGRVQAYCRSHSDATLGQGTSKIVGVAVRS